MAVEIKKPAEPQGFVLDRRLYLNADKTKVLEEGDPAAAYVLGGAGVMITPEEAEMYGLADETYVPAKGKLPDTFPGHAALAEAGINTYAQLRKAGDVTEIQGIGKATAVKIEEALKA